MNPSVSQADVVIVGGGLAGLAAAAFAARADGSVVLFEKAARLGGRAATDNRDGYLFNRGAHALYPGGPGSDVLSELGITFETRSPKHIRVLLDDQLYPLPASPTSLLQTSMLRRWTRSSLPASLRSFRDSIHAPWRRSPSNTGLPV